MVVTGLSVAVALGIGSVQLISLLVDSAGIRSGPLAAIGRLDLAAVGYTTVALFIFTWLVALGVWRFGHIEERWSVPVPEDGPEQRRLPRRAVRRGIGLTACLRSRPA